MMYHVVDMDGRSLGLYHSSVRAKQVVDDPTTPTCVIEPLVVQDAHPNVHALEHIEFTLYQHRMDQIKGNHRQCDVVL